MKKIIAILLVLCVFTLCACETARETSQVQPDESSQSAPEASKAPSNEASDDPEGEQPAEPSEEPSEEPLLPENGYADTTVDASGYFVSDYGCGVDIELRWTLKTVASGKLEFVGEIYLLSYSIQLGPRYTDCYVEINGEKIPFTTEAVSSDQNSKKEYSYLATVTTELDLTEDCHAYDITASYRFRGTYSGVSLPTLDVSSYINVQLDGTVEY